MRVCFFPTRVNFILRPRARVARTTMDENAGVRCAGRFCGRTVVVAARGRDMPDGLDPAPETDPRRAKVPRFVAVRRGRARMAVSEYPCGAAAPSMNGGGRWM